MNFLKGRQTFKYPHVKYHKFHSDNMSDSQTILIEDEPHNRTQQTNGGIFYRAWRCLKSVPWKSMEVFDFVISSIFRLYIYIYWSIAGRLPKFIDSYCVKNDKVASLQLQLQEASSDIRKLNEQNHQNREEIDHLEKEAESLRDRISKLESEKQAALTRLSEVVSAKLRDNNPNIVDLNDQCRPTKLAEMFSELYDNEWTNAYTTLEEPFGEQQAIVILLDIVMEAYRFCGERVALPWNILLEWFLDMNLPGAQQTSKWLKDSRKAKIRNKVPDVGKDFGQKLLEKANENKLTKLLSQTDMDQYINKCVELCLLMVTTDPPVILSCPGWAPGLEDQANSSTSQPALVDKENENAPHENKEGNENPDLRQNTEEKKQFNKELFKEYTTRGRYLDYVVWPALFLHQDGPLLSKGIAQGIKEQHGESGNEQL